MFGIVRNTIAVLVACAIASSLSFANSSELIVIPGKCTLKKWDVCDVKISWVALTMGRYCIILENNSKSLVQKLFGRPGEMKVEELHCWGNQTNGSMEYDLTSAGLYTFTLVSAADKETPLNSKQVTFSLDTYSERRWELTPLRF